MATGQQVAQPPADVPVPYTVTAAGLAAVAPAVRPGYRLVPVLVGRSTEPGTVAWVECPDWCIVHSPDRPTDKVGFLEDINHQGERAAMNFVPSRGDRVPVEVYLSQWPALDDEDRGQTYLAVDLDYEVCSYGRTAALSLADQMVAFAADVTRLAETLPDDSPTATVRSQADEALRRVREGGGR
ncbi:DUF6907 domain-containing protein [Streptomyces sp. NPDC059786]|uniref:DUF6907 domain-containing protein n=1 Tax=Streptomyces sp. NPDC059786 TaxID=3346946 RepID=UPI00364BEC30